MALRELTADRRLRPPRSILGVGTRYGYLSPKDRGLVDFVAGFVDDVEGSRGGQGQMGRRPTPSMATLVAAVDPATRDLPSKPLTSERKSRYFVSTSTKGVDPAELSTEHAT